MYVGCNAPKVNTVNLEILPPYGGECSLMCLLGIECRPKSRIVLENFDFYKVWARMGVSKIEREIELLRKRMWI